MIKPYKNEEWLKSKYLKEGLSSVQIADDCKVCFSTITRKLKKFNIPIRSHTESMILHYKVNRENYKYKNEEWLKKKYIEEKLNAYKIMKLCNITGHDTIYNWLKKFNIPIRSYSEAIHLDRINHCNLSQEAIKWINGELLGDGCLSHSKTKLPSVRFSYGSKYSEYVQYVSTTLQSFGIKKSGKIGKHYDKRHDVYWYSYQSCFYEELSYIRKRWYPKGKKIIPKNLELTPLTCRQWYIGDGHLYHKKNSKTTILLATCCFSDKEVFYLINQLDKIGFKATKQKRNIIHILAYSTKDFLEYIGKCPVKCYQYKWDFKKLEQAGCFMETITGEKEK